MGLTPSPELALLLAGILTMLVWPPVPTAAGVPSSRRAAHRSCRACHQPLPALVVSNQVLLGRYHQHLTDQVMPSTRRLYIWCVRDFLAYCKARRKTWDKATPRQLRDWLNRATRPGSPAKGQTISSKTRISYEVAVCGLYRWAYGQGLIRSDPMAAWQRTGRYEPAERYVDRPAIRRAIATASDHGDWRLVIILHLGIGAGLRAQAIAALRIEDIRLSSRVLTAVRKGGGSYRVPLGDDLAEALGAYLAGRPRSGPLLTGRGRHAGRPISATHVSRIGNAHLRACGIGETMHALRHTAGKEIAEVEGIRAAQGFLGHASIATTERVYLKGADAHVWRGVLNRPRLSEDFEVMGPPRGALIHDRVGGPRGFGLRAHPEPAAMLAEGHEPWRRHQPPHADRDPAAD